MSTTKSTAPARDAERDDPGLFGPHSVTWQVHSDPILWVGGLRALLLQALHPQAMAGIAEHSSFRSDPWGRLIRTANYVGVTTFGTTAQAEAAGRTVRSVHSGLAGVDPVSSLPYTVDDPALLAWVHCCLVDSFLTTHRRAGGTLAPGAADTYVAEQRQAATLVGLEPEQVPGSASELADYFRDQRLQLRLTPAALEAARYVLVPPMPLWLQVFTPARLAWTGVATLSGALLPRWARILYGMPGLPTTDLAATAGLRILAAAAQPLPQRFREGPHLRSARERLARNPSSARRLRALPDDSA